MGTKLAKAEAAEVQYRNEQRQKSPTNDQQKEYLPAATHEKRLETTRIKPLRLRRGEKLPEGAIRLSDHEVVQIHERKVLASGPFDYWALKFGPAISCTMTVAASSHINNLILEIYGLTLRQFGRSLFAVVFLPSLSCAGAHHYMVTNDVLCGGTECSVCVELRSASVQSLLGFLFPLVLSPLSAILGHPHLYKNKKVVPWTLEQIRKSTPLQSKLFMIFLGLWSAGGLLAQQEIRAFNQMVSKNQESSHH